MWHQTDIFIFKAPGIIHIFIKGGSDGYECDSTLDRGNGENIFSRMNKRSNEGHVCQAAKERNGCEGNHFL